jgi:hypothetical protein
MTTVQITEKRLKELETREEMYSIASRLHAQQKQRADDMGRYIAILVMRLHGESRDTCSPEVNDLLDAYPLDWAMKLMTEEVEA